ncbi:MAG: hypothetical protein IJ493_04825 [Clostridia bacterium]|nr:hypothetical protein [Clostridia bacterium]
MRQNIQAFLPLIAIAIVLGLVCGLFGAGYRSFTTLTLDDCGGLLDSIAIRGSFYDPYYYDPYSRDSDTGNDWGCEFRVTGGETVIVRQLGGQAAADYCGHLTEGVWSLFNNIRGYAIGQKPFIIAFIPEDAKMTRVGDLNPDYPILEGVIDGVAGTYWTECYTIDKVNVQLALHGFHSLGELASYGYKNATPLGEPRTITAEEYGDIRVWFPPQRTDNFLEEPDPLAYDYTTTVYITINGEEIDPTDFLWSERTGSRSYRLTSVDLLCADRIGGAAVWVTEIDTTDDYIGTKRIYTFPEDTAGTLEWFSADHGRALCAIRDGDSLHLSVLAEGLSGKPGMTWTLDDEILDTSAIMADDNAAVFRVLTADHAYYAALSPDTGKLLAYGDTAWEYPIGVYTDYRLVEYLRPSWDALWDGERLYVLDLSDYKTWLRVDAGGVSGETYAGLLTEYGGGAIGYVVSVSVMDKNGGVAMNLHPFTASFSGGSGDYQYVQLFLERSKEP